MPESLRIEAPSSMISSTQRPTVKNESFLVNTTIWTVHPPCVLDLRRDADTNGRCFPKTLLYVGGHNAVTLMLPDGAPTHDTCSH